MLINKSKLASLSLITVLILSITLTAGPPQRFKGQTDRLSKGKFYKSYGKKISPDKRAAVAHLAIIPDKRTREEYIPASRETAFQPLLTAMNIYLDSLGWSSPVYADNLQSREAPYVYLGSAEGETAPSSSELLRSETDKYPPMVIYIEKASGDWRRQLQESEIFANHEYLLVLRLGISEFPKADRGLFGKKVRLGTGYEQHIKFLSAEDKPVSVLLVSGLLLDREGKTRRAGAEGIISEDTPFWAQVFDIKKSVGNDDVERLLNETRREDIPGRPLAWKVALHNLMAQLLPNPQLTMQPGS